ncbi:aldo/keto reductase [Flavilitoribacter nigricans]|uniref:Aldo/keto reductase n=1 Tax=Flavilitoribacter nigricans (strain ATCC 23147 / DSM 23189 / NBRC 102662 / NCIMB 1420 / SS-2) TaxID=1122177 RepID=A0A2D0NCL7_FLAN2|nr:aldo/keto reductase [Flavilitoribacter nigricans]PHN06235.1 aldo/keto reductase [Flavilitoribacter nigricans DSM 23189 = NBRC 102662]
MEYRTLGRTGFVISEVSLGTWQVGGKWGAKFDHKLADSILNTAVDNGVNFIDTADVYGDGESEKAVGKLVRSHADKIYVASKCGRKISPHINENYTPEALRGYVEASLKNMGLEQIDLIQLHCPPTEVYYRPEIFAEFDKMIQEGKISKLGVSVEKVEEALKAIEYSNVDTVQIIFNMFRQRPDGLFFQQAAEKNIGIIARVPLASGLLSGKFSRDTTFLEDDHRTFNRDGAAFDKGETFSGVDYDLGLEAVEEIRHIFPDQNLAQIAIKWVLMHPEVSCVIPGASRPEQVDDNLATIGLPPLTDEQMAAVKKIYDHKIKAEVHQLW